MDLREIGAMLREERERQGLSIDEVSGNIKITRTCLAAIEEGNESALPHPVYAKGFIKNYAKLLGVDTEDFRRGLAEVYQVDEPVLQDVQFMQDAPDGSGDSGMRTGWRLRRGPVAALIVVLLFLGWGGWYLFSRGFSTSSNDAPVAGEKGAAPTPVPVVPPAPASAPDPVKAEPVAPVEAPAPVAKTPPSAESRIETKPAVAPTAEDQATQDIATSGPASPSVPAVPGPGESVAPAQPAPAARTLTVGEHGNHVVTIFANDRCWLQAGADGGSMHEAMLEKGDTFTGRFADYLLVRLGNAGAVEIRFDNKLYPMQAGKGSVKTLKFVAKKVEEETARPAPQSETPPAAPGVSATPPPAAAPASGETSRKPKEVEVFGQDGSWVIVKPDNGQPKEIYVKKGQRVTLSFDDRIEIKLGNPSKVVFRYDGTETPVATEKGEIKTVRFPPNGQ